MADELTWDYTGDESSPLLQRAASPFYRWAFCFRTWTGSSLHAKVRGRVRLALWAMSRRLYRQTDIFSYFILMVVVVVLLMLSKTNTVPA